MATSDQQLCQDLFQLLDQVKLQLLHLAEMQGLTSTQLFAIYSIDHHGELAMHQAAEVLHCDASNITGIVDRLVTQNLVERRERPLDRRTKMLVLTDRGRQVVQSVKDALPDRLGCAFITASERATLHTVIQKLCR